MFGVHTLETGGTNNNINMAQGLSVINSTGITAAGECDVSYEGVSVIAAPEEVKEGFICIGLQHCWIWTVGNTLDFPP